MIFSDIVLPIVRDLLRTECGFRDEQCYITPDDRPFADRGQLSVIVYPGVTQTGPNVDQDADSIEIEMSFSVGVSKRSRNVPKDRWFKHLYSEDDGVIPTARKVFERLRCDRFKIGSLIADEFTDLESVYDWKLVEPFKTISSADVRQVNAEHFVAERPVANSQQICGLFLPIDTTPGRFMGCKRVPAYNDGYTTGFQVG